MRDGLTFLAGLFLLALLGALVGPIFVDWNQHRSLIEDQLRRATGIDVVTTGPIHVRFLPSPRLKISGLRLGEADPQGTRATAALLRADMELAPLLGGTIKVSSLELDGVDLRLAVRDGALVVPQSVSDRSVIPAVARMSITRGQVSLLDDDGSLKVALPFALEASQPQASGPMRVDGDVAGRTIRLTTGDRDANGRVRIKLASSDAGSRAEFDGWLAMEPLDNSRVGFSPEGQVQMALLSATDATPLMTVGGRLKVGRAGTSIESLVVDSTLMGRLEGALAWGGDWAKPAAINLQSRRMDANSLVGAESVLHRLREGLGWVEARLPDVDLTLTADQMSFRGEEATEGQLRLERRRTSWQPAGGQLRFAGASFGFRQAPDRALSATLDVPDLRRIALAMQRLEMPQGLAEDIAALGQLGGSAELAQTDGGWRVRRWQAQGRFGQASGTADIGPDRVAVRAALTGADVLFLIRPIGALTELVGRDLDLSLSGQNMRMGDGPTGIVNLDAKRIDRIWRVHAASARGFDGVELDLKRATASEPLQVSLRATRADAIGAVAERFVASQQLTRGLRALRGLSPVRLDGLLTERGTVWNVATTGQAGGLALEVRAQVGRDGGWQSGDIVLSAAERGVLFRTLGLPEPAARTVATRLAVRFGPTGPVIVMTGGDGLIAEARGNWVSGQPGVLAGLLDVTLQAPSGQAILPTYAVGAGSDAALAGRFRLGFGEGSLVFDAIDMASGGLPVRGQLTLASDGAVRGKLALPAVDVARFADWLNLGALVGPDNKWSSARFPAPRSLPNLMLSLESGAFNVPLLGQMAGSGQLQMRDGVVSLSNIALKGDGLAFAGSVEGERNGGLLALRAAGSLNGLDLGKSHGQDFAGGADVSFQIGASAESPARLVASLTGAGQVTTRGVTIGRLDAGALGRIASSLGRDITVPDAGALAQTVRRNVEAGSWRLQDGVWPFVIAGGLVRLSPVTDERLGTTLSLAGSYDARVDQADLRAAMQSNTLPQGWTGPPPQIAMTWRGPWREPVRSYDVSALSNAVSQRALQREIERVEALEADIRERASFNRRLRAERERREEEQRQAAAEAQRASAEAQRAAEERSRAVLPIAPPFSSVVQPQQAPPLPPPLNVNPVPQPLSRPISPIN